MVPSDLTTYVSSGAFAKDVTALFPEGPFCEVSTTTDEELAKAAEVLPAPVRKELLALGALARAGKLPRLGRVSFDVGYSLAADLGDALDAAFEGGGTPLALARTAIGIARVDGGKVVHLLLADGHVAALSTADGHDWLWVRFASLGEYGWVLLHGMAAAAGTFPVAKLKAALTALDCVRTARNFDIPAAVLPPSGVSDDDDAPAWLK